MGNLGSVQMVTSNPQIADFPAGRTSLVHWKCKDVLEIEGVLELPANYETAKTYPLVTIIHGGPAGGLTIGFAPHVSAIPVPLAMDGYFPQLFTEHGDAGFLPNIREGRANGG